MFHQTLQFLSHLKSSAGSKALLRNPKGNCQGNARELTVILDLENLEKTPQQKFKLYHKLKFIKEQFENVFSMYLIFKIHRRT